MVLLLKEAWSCRWKVQSCLSLPFELPQKSNTFHSGTVNSWRIHTCPGKCLIPVLSHRRVSPKSGSSLQDWALGLSCRLSIYNSASRAMPPAFPHYLLNNKDETSWKTRMFPNLVNLVRNGNTTSVPFKHCPGVGILRLKDKWAEGWLWLSRNLWALAELEITVIGCERLTRPWTSTYSFYTDACFCLSVGHGKMRALRWPSWKFLEHYIPHYFDICRTPEICFDFVISVLKLFT